MGKLDPIKILEELINNNAKSMATFGEVYISYLEVLNEQAFEPNGYRLFVEKMK